MIHSIRCRACGQPQELPAGYSRPHFTCRTCGVINEMPAPVKDKVPEHFDMFKEGPAKSAAAPSQTAAPAGDREVLIQGTDDEWDRNPYSVRGDVPTAKCPACGQALHEGVTLCKHCGADLAARAKEQRTFEPIDRTWDNGWPLEKRVAVFGILQVINLAVMIAPWLTGQSATLYWSGAIATAALQVFLLGTFDRLHLTRNAKGKAAITQTWRFAFLARPPQKIRWQEHEGVRLVVTDETELFDIVMAIILFLYAVVPGLLFWWYVVAPDKCEVALCKEHGLAATIVCRTTNHERAQELVSVIAEAVELPVLK